MDIIENLATAIDQALDDQDAIALRITIDEIDRLLEEAADNAVTILYYFRANAYSALRGVKLASSSDQLDWKQPELSEEILSLRKSISANGFAQLNWVRQCQILTNLGNALNVVGRPIEAVAAWDKALKIEPKFAMAAANRAVGLVAYSAAFYDSGHQCLFLAEAVKGYRVALRVDAIWDCEYPASVKEAFRGKLSDAEEYLSKHCDLSEFSPHKFDIGRSAGERAFNEWRLKHRLFLNPLNDLAAWPIAAQDVFHLPSHSYQLDEEVRFPRYYDLIKQEYVAACVLLFEGLDEVDVHHADENLLTFNHGDYSVSSVRIEKQKAAFRMAYSILDKCAVFINDYFQIGQNPKSLNASFRKVWLKPKTKNLNELLPLKNWRLRGLYAISLDLFDDDLKEVTSPLALPANSVRNAIEHRFLSVYEFGKPDKPPALNEVVNTDELEKLTLHMLGLARSTIMGLSLAMYHQENHLKPKSENTLTLPLIVMPTQR